MIKKEEVEWTFRVLLIISLLQGRRYAVTNTRNSDNFAQFSDWGLQYKLLAYILSIQPRIVI